LESGYTPPARMMLTHISFHGFCQELRPWVEWHHSREHKWIILAGRRGPSATSRHCMHPLSENPNQSTVGKFAITETKETCHETQIQPGCRRAPFHSSLKKEEMKDFNDKARPPPDHQKELVKLINSLGYRHSHWQVFSDFVEMGAISLSNAVDLANREKREARYMEVIKRYRADELQAFPKMLAELTLALEHKPEDVLGRSFHDLELHNKWAGQYFTPDSICQMMAKMILTDSGDIEAKIKERGFLTAQEPACGSGAMVIALAHEMHTAGINYQQHLHVTAVDVDTKCVHMAYLQFSLLHIPAIIVHGNSLSLEVYAHWYTPAHIVGGWTWKLRQNHVPQGADEIQTSPEPISQAEQPNEEAPASPPLQLTLF
jgi:hypothetical protein